MPSKPHSHEVPFHTVFDSFSEYTLLASEEEDNWSELPLKGETCLADLINDWLWWGGGVSRCFGSFEVFLKVVSYLIDYYYRLSAGKNVISAGHHGGTNEQQKYRVISVFGYQPKNAEDDNAYSHPIFDRDNFAGAVWETRSH